MTLRGNTSQACAACKYQRRKCTPECPLAPYFPSDQPKMFQNVHRLFGVKKIQKILETLHPTQQPEAMNSIIYQANARDRFPVLGCIHVLQVLQLQIYQCEEELKAVNNYLMSYRQLHTQQQIPSNDPTLIDINSSSQLQLGTNNAPSLCLQNPQPAQHYGSEDGIPVSQNFSYSSSNSPYASSYLDAKDTLVNSMWIPQPYNSENGEGKNDNSIPLQPQLVVSESPAIQQETLQNYNEMHPYFDIIDDRQSYIESSEAFASSPESSIKDATQCIEHIAESELKNAAAHFSLTSVN